METDVLVVEPSAYDEDGDDIILSFSEPFNVDGIWETEDGDAGEYTAYVKASDGTDTVTETFKIVIDHINTRPTLDFIQDIEVDEGDLVKINVDASDAEDDKLTITFSGWMSSDTYRTTYDDAGEHYVQFLGGFYSRCRHFFLRKIYSAFNKYSIQDKTHSVQNYHCRVDTKAVSAQTDAVFVLGL